MSFNYRFEPFYGEAEEDFICKELECDTCTFDCPKAAIFKGDSE